MKIFAAIIEEYREPAVVQIYSTREVALMALSEEMAIYEDEPPLLTLEQLNELSDQISVRLEEIEVIDQA